MNTGELLHCPIRGKVIAPERAADGLRYSEEKRRIDSIQFLLGKGYPPTHMKVETTLLRFGNQGRNSFRTDLAVLDAPASTLPSDIEELKPHIKLIAEIKRDNAEAISAKKTQIYPALDFIQDVSALGLYWDDIEQRLFYRTTKGTKMLTHETSAALLPRWGQALGVPRLRAENLRTTNLLDLFRKAEDRLHAVMADKDRRFTVMLQLLLLKLFDEHRHRRPNLEMDLQDFADAPLGDDDVVIHFEKMLKNAIGFYGNYLPSKVPEKINVTGAMLRRISSLLAPVSILEARRDVIQDFYMYFAQGVYKWDMGQYFTPTEVVDFIVSLANPQSGDSIKDPACGSGDFLIAAMHQVREKGSNLGDAIWGSDNSMNAVQVCVLNMVLNGDGKSNITREDSLECGFKDIDRFSVLLSNPPFGVKIVETRFDVLKNFALGHEWTGDAGVAVQSSTVAKSQQTGILFAELCVRQAIPGGRIGIVLPNGYLGNGSSRYLALREWLLCQTRLVAVVAFPRFTFKKSGADVSASVLILEKRSDPLQRAVDSERYPFHVGLLESVGWSVGDKGGDRIYKRDPKTGAYLLDGKNEQIINADFDRVLKDFWSSKVADVFPWVAEGRPREGRGWSVDISQVLARSDLSIDPKRWCERVARARKKIAKVEHFALGDVVDVIPIVGNPDDRSGVYRYVEIEATADGVAMPTELRGWQLPDRAKHRAQPGEIFVGKVWSSVGKWFVAGLDCANLVVTNGFHRMRLKKGKESLLLDIVVGLNTEAYRIQARAFATGSDGLADLPEPSLREIILPAVTDKATRSTLRPMVDALLAGRSTVASVVSGLQADGSLVDIEVTPRTSHVVQV
ncbi:MAG: class I SAM-dependent DNA methyltransferase [Thermoguttaceae bacterium]